MACFWTTEQALRRDGPHEFHLQVLRRRLQKAQHAQPQAILGLVGGNVVLLDTRCQRHDNSPKMMIEKHGKPKGLPVYPPLSPMRSPVPAPERQTGTNTETLRSSTGGAPPKRRDALPSKRWSVPNPLPFRFRIREDEETEGTRRRSSYAFSSADACGRRPFSSCA